MIELTSPPSILPRLSLSCPDVVPKIANPAALKIGARGRAAAHPSGLTAIAVPTRVGRIFADPMREAPIHAVPVLEFPPHAPTKNKNTCPASGCKKCSPPQASPVAAIVKN